MGGKKKGKKGKKKKEEPEPEDDYMKMDGETLEKNMASLKEKLQDAQIKRNMLQMEKDMIHDFYHNTRAEIKELEARVKNLDTDMQSMEETHRTQIKVYMQKVKHLEYTHANNCDKVKDDASKYMKSERMHHSELDKEMLKEKRKLKEALASEDISNQTDIEAQENILDGNLTQLVKDLNFQRENLIDKYEKKLKDLKEELELRMKVEIHEIEERKNQHINELMKNHEEAFREMKEYHNDITRENLELIRMSKEKLEDIRNQILTNQ